MPGAARRIALLARLRSHLEPGGRIAINFLPRSGPLNSGDLRIAAATARLTGSDCPWEPNDLVQLVHGPRRRYVLHEHYFVAEEVVEEARRAGLRPHGTDAPAVPALVIVGR